MVHYRIWLPGEKREHEFVWFRRAFQLKERGDAVFRISAPDQFVAALDGSEILRGQFADYPDVKTYSEIKLHLEPGRHEITVQAYFCGRDFGDCTPGVPALRAEFQMFGCEFGSDTTWQCCSAAEFLRDRFDCNQYGFAISFDARQEDSIPEWSDADDARRFNNHVGNRIGGN